MITKMTKPPLLEMSVELNFTSTDPDILVVGMIEKEMSKDFEIINKIDGDTINIVKSDKDIAWVRMNYKGKKENIACLITPNSFSLNWAKYDYEKDKFPGWNEHLKDIFIPILEKIGSLKNIDFKSVSYKSIDVFRNDKLFKNSNFSIKLNNNDLITSDNNIPILSFQQLNGKVKNYISISDSAAIVSGDEKYKFIGAILDIRSVIGVDDITGLSKAIDSCHIENKKIFSTILQKDFAKNALGAQYDNAND